MGATAPVVANLEVLLVCRSVGVISAASVRYGDPSHRLAASPMATDSGRLKTRVE